MNRFIITCDYLSSFYAFVAMEAIATYL